MKIRMTTLWQVAGAMLACVGTLAAQQDEAVKGCRAFAALSTSAYYDNIYVNLDRQNSRRASQRLTWEAWVSDEQAVTGTCESDARGTIIRFDRLAEKNGRKPAQPAIVTSTGGFNQTNPQQGGFNQTQTGGFNGGGQQQALGALTIENPIKGAFNGLGMNTSIDRARVVMQNGRATVMLAGGFGGFNRVTLSGQVTKQMSDREFEITIDGADRTRVATGTILLRTTPAHNVVEAIVVNGLSGNQPFGGNFNQ